MELLLNKRNKNMIKQILNQQYIENYISNNKFLSNRRLSLLKHYANRYIKTKNLGIQSGYSLSGYTPTNGISYNRSLRLLDPFLN